MRCPVFILVALSAALVSQTFAKKDKTPAFSYYMLVLSYAPDFCVQPHVDTDPRECGAGGKIGFVVHGLWPQGETTRGPENCKPAPTPSPASIAAMLKYFPTEKLAEHEWSAHGTCSGLGPDDYFALIRKARDAVQIPDSL